MLLLLIIVTLILLSLLIADAVDVHIAIVVDVFLPCIVRFRLYLHLSLQTKSFAHSKFSITATKDEAF